MVQNYYKNGGKKMKEKTMKTVKILTITLLVILISMISFVGIYQKNKNKMENKVKDYSYSMSLNGARTIKLKVNTESTDDVPNNSEEVLTAENYKKSKEVIEKRLNKMNVEEYTTSVNEATGEITIQIPEQNSQTDTIIGNLNTVGKFEILDSETKEVLLNNDDIKSSEVLYNTTNSGTSVYLQIEFNKNGKDKLKNVSQTYVSVNNTTNNTTENNVAENTTSETENEATNTTTEGSSDTATTEKKITMKIDDQEIMSTSFDEPITTGKIQLSVGSATTDKTTLQNYVDQAQSVATTLDTGKMPVKYDLEKNQYILPETTTQDLVKIEIAVAIIALVGIIILIVKHKLNGLLAGIAYVGLSAVYMLVVRYTNVTISIESIAGIIIVLILNYIFTTMFLNKIEELNKEKAENVMKKATGETYKKFYLRIIPICIMAITFSFVKWVPISSFGMITFWGIVIIVIYNAIITRYLLKANVER
jgi:preprotein translocase subunit SecD